MMSDNEKKTVQSSIFSEKRKTLILLVGGLLLASITMLFLEWQSSPDKPAVSVVVSKKVEKKREVALYAEVTDCDKITTAVDTTGVTIGYSDYRRVAGFVENRGDIAVKFVRVLVIWRNEEDRILQSEEIFAVGDKVLLPGQRARFEDSTRNYLIQKCGAKIIDWWVADQQYEPSNSPVTDESL